MSSDQQQPMETTESTTSTGAKPKASRGPRQKPRGNNAAQRRQDGYRERIGSKVLLDYRSKRQEEHLGKLADLTLFEVPKGLSLANAIKMSVRYPVSSMGISFAISSLYSRFARYLEPHVSVFQLLRLSFAQYEFQLYMSSQNSSKFYPYDEPATFDFPSEYRNVLRAHSDNFQAIVSIIETIGNVTIRDTNFIPTMPSRLRGKRHFKFTDLESLVQYWSLNSTDWRDNPLPGAIIRMTDDTHGVLTNPQDFWPPNYTGESLRADAVAVMQAMEAMRTRFDRITGKCKFDGVGRPAMLVSTSNPFIGVPYVEDNAPAPTRSGNKRTRLDSPSPPQARLPPLSTQEYAWYSAVPMETIDLHLGAVSLVGITSSEMEAAADCLRVRSPYACAQRITDSWQTIFDWMLPKVGRSGI